MAKIVFAKQFEGYTFSLFRAPKWEIICGNCGQLFIKRIVLASRPYAICDHCQATNRFRGIVYE